MKSFDTKVQAKDFMRQHVDRPVIAREESLGDGLRLKAFTKELGGNTFANVYDVSFRPDQTQPNIALHNRLTGVYDHVTSRPEIRSAISGGFFFLADEASASPRQLSLNLALADGRMQGLPVVDREALLMNDGRITAQHVRSLGTLTINAAELSWSGSLTDYDTDVKVYGTGNSRIVHEQREATGSVRVLDESSRYTPPIEASDQIDVGFVMHDSGDFMAATTSAQGSVDIFSHDVVLRMHERHVAGETLSMQVCTLDDRALDGGLRGGITVGPMLDTDDFAAHPINHDSSLGSVPPLADRSMARAAVYETDDDRVHLRLYDGRPGSEVFVGVTPQQAAQSILAEQAIKWGCFLDSGQTAKLITRTDDGLQSHGNTHYLRWPSRPDEKFVWVPKVGRPVANSINLY